MSALLGSVVLHAAPIDTLDDKGRLFMPLIYQQNYYDSTRATTSTGQGLVVDDSWLVNAKNAFKRAKQVRHEAMMAHPDIVRYNANTLPEPPKDVVVDIDPAQNVLEIASGKPLPKPDAPIDRREIKMRNWIHTLVGTLHFTQAFISDNWYQGGENNINALGQVKWDFNLNEKLHPKWLFQNSLKYKLGVITAQSDTIRDYAVNEDNFQFSSKLGYKAIERWYYSATLNFQTQFFKTYKPNTYSMKACFLSPGELNVGLGMTYNYKDKNEYKVFTLSLAPLSWNLKICDDIVHLDPTSFGIDTGHHTKHTFGSNLEAKLMWKVRSNIQWSSRFYVFTNYDYVQGDFENTLDFSITKHLNTQIFVHLRYDESRERDPDWKHWQLKEILSFGLTYRFATN